ncbi:SF1B family DNA helicase RecD2 [Furfurilactobacillus milii]|uniref:ATP-dependent RecD2 DNA helicase n=1 Tax=Furfurilactobacillus rossiae TaxID=231049 RepID=A0A7C9N5J0_9LACO|nr:ATP-dependent RecD-like DNA helicase [Furfurilactobacillus milii]MYV04606.1 ATP-dependent RecD-like DNA helicase [Furfurilactobacillus milii]
MAESMSLFDDNTSFKPNYVVGKVAAIFFSSSDSFYKVLLVHVDQTDLDWIEDEIVVTGSFGDVAEEGTYRFIGKVVDHPKYGKQFNASNYENETPTSKTGLVKYLSSDQFPGLGKKTAERIVETLGTGVIDKVVKNPDVLKPIGLKKSVADHLIEVLTENHGTEQIIIGLNGFGFGSQLASTIYEKYKQDTLHVIQENPYQLVEDINGVSFKRADQIAEQLGFDADAPGRLRAALLETISDICFASGNTFAELKPLIHDATALLESARNVQISPDMLANQLIAMAKDQLIVGNGQQVYLKSLYDTEWDSAEHLMRLQQQQERLLPKDVDLDHEVRLVEKQLGITYDDAQKDALVAAISSPVYLLTGGPGTGKTTIINGIVALFARIHELSLDINEYEDGTFPILLAAPTGRAAKRMSEVTDLPASTIHRLLGLTGREDEATQSSDKDLEGGLLIVDEMSMVDAFLFRTLIQAVPNHMQVILVGDQDQLPSVGPGQVFADLLKSDCLPSTELTTIYRQDDSSSIIPLAHAIKHGELPADFTVNQTDRSFFAARPYQVVPLVNQVVARAKSRGFAKTDIQVLAPMYRGAAGINALNTALQDTLNPKTSARTKEVEAHNEHFRIGDKVLHLVNSPENNVFNGDMGEIVGIDLATDKTNEDKVDKLTIAFDQTEVTYGRAQFDRVTLAYCVSIHKAQGSQFKLVILPLVPQFRRMLQRNLLYTAVTRAQQWLILVGDEQSFAEAAANKSANRQTTLQARLRQVFKHEGDDTAEVVDQTAPSSTSDGSVADASASATMIDAEAPITQATGSNYATTSESAQLSTKAKEGSTNVEKSSATTLDEESGTLGEPRLTTALILSGNIDPLIGMGKLTPQDFAPEEG